MIPSIYSVVTGYRAEGRLNEHAILTVLYGPDYDVPSIRKQPLETSHAVLIDACVLVDLHIGHWMKYGCTPIDVKETIALAVERAHQYNPTTIPYHEDAQLEMERVRQYIVNCGLLNYNSTKRKQLSFIERVREIGLELGCDRIFIGHVYGKMPMDYTAQFISGMSDEQIRTYITAYMLEDKKNLQGEAET